MKEKHLLFLVTLVLLIGMYMSISGGERYDSKPKYLLVKGWCGFADRLQCMSAAMTYAKKHNRIVCVDWTDSIWKGDTPNMNFDTFFELTCEGVSTVPLDELLKKQNELSIYLKTKTLARVTNSFQKTVDSFTISPSSTIYRLLI
jgi:hypothetical protein